MPSALAGIVDRPKSVPEFHVCFQSENKLMKPLGQLSNYAFLCQKHHIVFECRPRIDTEVDTLTEEQVCRIFRSAGVSLATWHVRSVPSQWSSRRRSSERLQVGGHMGELRVGLEPLQTDRAVSAWTWTCPRSSYVLQTRFVKSLAKQSVSAV